MWNRIESYLIRKKREFDAMFTHALLVNISSRLLNYLTIPLASLNKSPQKKRSLSLMNFASSDVG